MTTIEVAETGPGVCHRLTDVQATALAVSGFVTIKPLALGEYVVAGAGKVGVARVGDVVVRVRPKVSIGKIFWLLGYAHNFGWRDDLVPYETTGDLFHVIAEAFARQADRALGRGVLQGYVSVDDELAVVRGRLRATEQVTRRFGQVAPLLVSYDEFSPDIPENQLLRSSASVLRRVPGLDPTVARRLRALIDRLDGVVDLRPGAPLPVWQTNRRNAHYQSALWFADVVLRYQSIDLRGGPLDVSGFMIDMAAVFEDFLTTALTDAFALLGGHVVAQDTSRSLDRAGTIELKPDIVSYRGNDPVAVIDAKYKAEKPAGYPNADVYQALAYCTALGLAEGHLVYAKGNEEPAVHQIRNSRVTVFAHALDLQLPPAQLLAQVGDIAAAVEFGLRRAHGQPQGDLVGSAPVAM